MSVLATSINVNKHLSRKLSITELEQFKFFEFKSDKLQLS